MDWKKIAPWNWFKEEEPTRVAKRPPRSDIYSDPFSALRTEMEQVFDDTVRSLYGKHGLPAIAGSTALRPSLDISEGKKAYTVRAEFPGVELADISIEVEGNTLVIRAEKRRESEEEEEGYHCVERTYGVMQRVLTLPEDADGQAIEAKFNNGVLKLRIPKHAARASNARSIEVRGS